MLSRIRWERWTPASGVAFVVLFVVAFIVGGDEIGNSDAEIVAYYGDGGTRASEIAAFFLVVVAVLFFLWFVSALRDRLSSVEAAPKSLSTLAFGAGVATAVLLVAALALFTVVSFEIEFRDEFQLDPNLARLIETAGILLFTGAVMFASVLVTATSVLALRTAVLPNWLGWLGLPVAVALLLAIFFFPFFVLLAWVLVVSVTLIVRPLNSQPTEQEMPETT